MMRHDHLNIIDMKDDRIGYTFNYAICVALPSGDSEWIEVCKDDYDRLRVKK